MAGEGELAWLGSAGAKPPGWICKRENVFSPFSHRVYGEVAYIMGTGRRTSDALFPIGNRVSIF